VQECGNRAYDEGRFEAARILYLHIKNYGRLASCLVHLSRCAGIVCLLWACLCALYQHVLLAPFCESSRSALLVEACRSLLTPYSV
jgi:hypothetical protein